MWLPTTLQEWELMHVDAPATLASWRGVFLFQLFQPDIIFRAMDVVEVWRPMTMNSCGQDTISAPKGVVSMYQSIIHRIIWSILQRIKQLFVRILWKCKIASYFYWKLKCIFFSCIIYSIYHHTEVWNNSWCHCMKTQKFDYSRS